MAWYKIPDMNRRNQVLLILALVIIAISSYFMHERYANAGAAKCGCSKCHTIELNGCEGCHNSRQSRQESDDTVTRSEEPHGEDSANPENNAALQEQKANSEKPNESESANPENDSESQKPQSSSADKPNSESVEPEKDIGKSETDPEKFKNQQGSKRAQK